MKYLKSYEKVKQNEPKRGDYILPQLKCNVESTWSHFSNNTIGKIDYYVTKDKKTYDIVIVYNAEEIPDELKYIQLKPANKNETKFYIILLLKKDTFLFSPNKTVLEIISDQTKYNL